MKAIKKLLAVVLAVCMLVGMPLSINVSATGNPSATDFNLVSAMIIPDSWGTGLDGDTQLSLYFTGGPIEIDTTAVKAFVGIGNAATTSGWYDGEQRTSIAGIYFTGTLSQSDALLGGTAKDGHKNPNNWIFTIDGAKTSWELSTLKPALAAYFDSPIDTLPEMLKLANLTKSDLKLSIGEVTGTNNDGVIDGVVESSSGTKLKARCNNLNLNDGNRTNSGGGDGAWCKVYDEDTAPQLAGVYLNESAKTLKIMSTHKMYYDYRGNAHVYVSIRVLNNRGMIHCYDETKGFFTYKGASAEDQQKLLSINLKLEKPNGIMQNQSTFNTYQLSDADYEKLMNWRALVAEHNATAAEDDQLAVSLVIEEQNDNTSRLPVGRGDGHQNHYFEAIWTTTSDGKEQGVPFMPTYTDIDGWVADCLAAEIMTAAELEEKAAENITITNVTTVERAGEADLVSVTFSEPIERLSKSGHQGSTPTTNNRETGPQPYIRVYDSTGKLMTHDKDTKKLTDTNEGHLQWAVSGWVQADISGSSWLGLVETRYECNTYDEIVAYCASLTDANGKAVTAENGYQIQFSILDTTYINGYDRIYGNALVDGIRSLDGTKRLYANNRQSDTEERATCNFSESLQVTGVDIYPNGYVVVSFSEDIDMAAALAEINGGGTTMWISAVPSIQAAPNPVCPNNDNKNHIQDEIKNAVQYGNAKDKILMTDFDYAGFKTKVDAYEEKYDTDVYEVLHMQYANPTGAPTGIMENITSADGQRLLYRSGPMIGTNWDGRHIVPISDVKSAVTVTNVKADAAKNALIVTFSDAIKYTPVNVPKADGTGTVLRTQINLQRFILNGSGKWVLDQTTQPNSTGSYLSQPGFTGSSPVDANGNEIEDEYSTTWAFYFNEGVVESAAAYYANGNLEYKDTVKYGFGVFECNEVQAAKASVLPLNGYMEDFATAPDANGNSYYLVANSTASGQRTFYEINTVEDDIVTADSAKLINEHTVEVSFSEPVSIINNTDYNYIALRVTENNNLIQIDGKDSGAHQLHLGTAQGVDAVNGYAKVWRFSTATNIPEWAATKYYNTEYAANEAVTLCFSIQENNSSRFDGAIGGVVNADGMALAAGKWHHGNDGKYINISNDLVAKGEAAAVINGEAVANFDAVIDTLVDGDTMVLIKDAVYTGADRLNVPAGATLDLNGKTLTMGTASIVATGSVIDSTEGKALIVIGQDTTQQFVQFRQDNAQLPVYDNANGGYRFYTTTATNKGTQGTGNYVKFGMHLNMTDFSLLAQEGNGGAKVVFRLATSELANKEGFIETELDATELAEYATSHTDNTVMFLGVTGMNNLQNRDNLIVTVRIESAGVWKEVTIAAIE